MNKYISMYNTMSRNERVSERISERIFRLIGMENKNPQTEQEKEICDIGFSRYRDVTVLEDCRIIMVTTRTGGGNRLEYKENIRDIRDHSLYIDDMDWYMDETYACWYFRVPVLKQIPLQNICNEFNINVRPLDWGIERKILIKLNNPNYVDPESDTDYSDKEDFKNRYGYWYSDDGQSETDDSISDEYKKMDEESIVNIDVLEEGISRMDL